MDALLQACKELVDDAKQGCPDLVFKEICLEILSKARLVLTTSQFKQLISYTSARMKERMSFGVQPELAMNK